MNATLNITNRTLGHSDPNNTTGNDPLKKSVDWGSNIIVSVNNPATVPYTLAPGASVTLFDGSRTIAADGTTQWTLSLSSLASDRYRFTHTSGTAPALRTDRGLTLSAVSVAATVNANQTVTFAAPAASFSAVQVGDVLFVPGPETGDASTVFSSLNQGFWTVLAVAANGSSVQVSRGSGTFTGFTETVTLASNAQLQAFSSSGVQVGDGVFVSAGFSTPVLHGYTVLAVNPKWFEVRATAALPVSAVATPGASGVLFYAAAKRYIELWSDQECVIRVNGDTGDSNKVSPWQAGDILQAGHYIKAGVTWSAVVVNKTTSVMNIQLITAE